MSLININKQGHLVFRPVNFENQTPQPYDFRAEETALNRLFACLGHHNLEKFPDDMEVDIRAFTYGEPAFRKLDGNYYENMWGERFTYRQTECVETQAAPMSFCIHV